MPGASVMPADPYVYAVLRVVPKMERGECLNIGVVLFCRPRRFLDARFELDRDRLRAFAPDLDLDGVARQVGMISGVVAGTAAGDSLAEQSQAERFGWMVSPASTVVQPGPVHAGLTSDPGATLARLFEDLVQLPVADA
ncbi:MAG: DUF3037 domain-containing protein [Chloroflexota bacterium]|nr:DUF3037 domain-containing protein [Chloroflexota bacterium]